MGLSHAFAAMLLACSLAGAHAQTPPAARPAPAKPKPGDAANVAQPVAGFSIEPVPAWVQAVPLDPSLAAPLPKAPLHLLLIDHQTRVDRGDESHFVHAVRQVNDSGGLEPGGQVQIEFDPSYQTLALHKLEIWRNGARIDKMDRRKVQMLQRESQLERQMVDGRSTASVVLDDLRVGDRVEFAYTLRGANPVFEGRFVDLEWTQGGKGPAALFRYRLLAPESRDIRMKLDNARHELSSSVKAGWRETVVRRLAAPQFQYDAYAPASVYLADEIQLSEFADWADVARWASRTFAVGRAGVTPAVQAQADAIARAAGSEPAARLSQTLDFVQKQVRYFGTEIGANSHRPADPDKVLQQRFGDCKDKATLLVALLKAQGIAATPLLVSTSMHGDVADMLPSPLAFNHAIAQVRLGDKAWVLDGTRGRQTGPLEERESLGLGLGLLADEAATALIALPDSRGVLRAEGEDRIVFTRLADDPTLDATLTYHGDAAESLRYALDAQPASELEKQLTAEYARHYPGAAPAAALQVDEVDGHNALRLRMRYKLPGYLRMPDPKYLAGDYGLATLAQELRLPDQVPRKLPMRLGTPALYRHVVDFSFPEEVYSRDSRQPFDQMDKHFELHVLSEGRRNGARFSGELALLRERLEAADWSAHRDLLVKLWPRISSSVTVPTVGLKQGAEMTERARALDRAAAQGSGRARTAAQQDAQVNVLIAQARLDTNRLPPVLRAKVLVELGTQQDHLGQANEAALSFAEALRLDPRSSEAHAAMSVNALLRREDTLAIEHATQALQIAPSDTAPRYTRAFANYYAGKAAQSRDEWLELLKNRSEVERGYATLWLHLATRKLGGDGVAATQAYKPMDPQPAWPYPVVQLLNGSGTLQQALNAAQADKKSADGRLCELYYYLGQQQLLDGQTQAARESFQKAVGTGVVEFTEYALAQRELQRLATR